MQTLCVKDFMNYFGKPDEEDPEMAYFLYTKKSSDGKLEIDFSFSGMMMNSFCIVLRCCGKDVGKIYSENMQRFEIRQENFKSGIHIVFGISGFIAELDILLEPDLYYDWRILQI